MDLDLEHYSLADLLRLFKLAPDFGEEDLKRAKRRVLLSHPDKSGLDPAVFLFFTQAYRIVHHVYQVRVHGKVEPLEVDESKQKKAAAEKFIKSPDFHKQFNELFERVYLKTEDEAQGYGDWLRSDQDLDATFEERKSAARALAVHASAEPAPSSIRAASLLGKDTSYASLKHVYTVGSVVGVEEAVDLPPARTAEQLKLERSAPIDPLNREEARRFLADAAAKEGTHDSDRAFELFRRTLAQEDETRRSFWGHLLRLT